MPDYYWHKEIQNKVFCRDCKTAATYHSRHHQTPKNYCTTHYGTNVVAHTEYIQFGVWQHLSLDEAQGFRCDNEEIWPLGEGERPCSNAVTYECRIDRSSMLWLCTAHTDHIRRFLPFTEPDTHNDTMAVLIELGAKLEKVFKR